MSSSSQLALLGGPKAVQTDPGDMFTWPIITQEDEEAVLEVLRRGAMSGTDVTQELEKEYAEWQGSKYALGFSTGTGAIEAAMFGLGIGVGDEIICPSITYWASALPCFNLQATVVFADIDPDTLCIDPNDIEHRITDRTKAIVVVHYCGHPCDMDAIMEISRKRNVPVLEDVSHAHGSLYRGKKVGGFGKVAAMSMMSGKSLAVGEAGMMTTDDREVYDRAIAWAHYGRFRPDNIETENLLEFCGLPMGGHKYRMHQLSSAMGRVQLRHYDRRIEEIQKAMNYFWDLLEGLPGLKAHRPAKDSGSTMGGWYASRAVYRPEELGGLSNRRFADAVSAEGAKCGAGMNRALHMHPLFNTCDIYGHGKPTRIANSDRDLRQGPGSLPVSEAANGRGVSIPWFKHYVPEIVEEHANAFRKAVEGAEELLEGDTPDEQKGGWGLSFPQRG